MRSLIHGICGGIIILQIWGGVGFVKIVFTLSLLSMQQKFQRQRRGEARRMEQGRRATTRRSGMVLRASDREDAFSTN